jgi:hypothetical protein
MNRKPEVDELTETTMILPAGFVLMKDMILVVQQVVRVMRKKNA